MNRQDAKAAKKDENKINDERSETGRKHHEFQGRTASRLGF
jgi:hypothetical protein